MLEDYNQTSEVQYHIPNGGGVFVNNKTFEKVVPIEMIIKTTDEIKEEKSENED